MIKKHRRSHTRVKKPAFVATENTQEHTPVAPTVNNTGVQPINTAINNSAAQPARPPVNMISTSANSTMSNDDLIKKYVIFDVDGRACGL